MEIIAKLEGLDELRAKMRKLSGEVIRKSTMSAARKAAEIIQQAAILNAADLDNPKSDEEIAKNIVVRYSGRHFRRTGDVMYRIGILGGARHRKGQELDSLPGGNTTHWRWLETGTSRTAAQPLLREAANNNGL